MSFSAPSAAIWLIKKNLRNIYEKVVEISVEERTLNPRSDPEDATRVELERLKETWKPQTNRKIRPPVATVRKFKFDRKYRAAGFKGRFRHRESSGFQMDYEYICFLTMDHRYSIKIAGPRGIFEKYGGEIEKIKRSVRILR
jgi:hypothetical protein